MGQPPVPIYPVPLSHTHALWAVNIICASFVWITIPLRFATRAFIVRSVGLDDTMMLVSAVLFSVYAGSIITITIALTGLEITAGFAMVPESKMTLVTNLILVSEAFYSLTMITLKISLGLFFLRVVVEPWQRRVVYGVMILSSVYGLVYLFFAIFQCGVANGLSFWIKWINGQCISKPTVLGLGYSHSFVVTSTDITFSVLPIFILWRSPMSILQKLVVGGILVLGAISGIASGVRMIWMKALADITFDYFNHMFRLTICSEIELGLGITAGSLATLRPLLRAFERHVQAIQNGRSRGANTGDKGKSFPEGLAQPNIPEPKLVEKGFSILEDGQEVTMEELWTTSVVDVSAPECDTQRRASLCQSPVHRVVEKHNSTTRGIASPNRGS